MHIYDILSHGIHVCTVTILMHLYACDKYRLKGGGGGGGGREREICGMKLSMLTWLLAWAEVGINHARIPILI